MSDEELDRLVDQLTEIVDAEKGLPDPGDHRDVVERAYEAGLIIPQCSGRFLEFWYYQYCGKFWLPDLERRRRLCPDLFKRGHNVVVGGQYWHLNQDAATMLSYEFPLNDFSTPHDVEKFCSEETFYSVENASEVPDEDVLGNEYAQYDGLMFIKINPSRPLGPYKIYSEAELTGSFLEHSTFVDPKSRTNERFSENEVARLQRILIMAGLSRNQGDALLSVISTLLSGESDGYNRINDALYFALHHRELVEDYLMKLLSFGMICRGWKDVERGYPLKSVDTVGDVDETLASETLCALLQADLDTIADLPLFTQRDGEYRMLTKKTEGKTIKGRLKIVFHNDGLQACIRMSSNVICATAHYYLNFFYNRLAFDLHELDQIS